MFTLVLGFNLGLMAYLFSAHCLQKGRVRVNPVLGLLLGSTYYVILPCAGIAYLGDLISGVTVLDYYFTQSNATTVMTLLLACQIALALGLRIPMLQRRRSRAGTIAAPRFPDGALCYVLLWASFIILCVVALQIRGSLFSGYDADTLANEAVWGARGTMSSLYSLMALLLLSLVGSEHSRSMSCRLLVSSALFFLASGLLLSIGARLYVVMALLSLLSLHASLRGGVPLLRLLAFAGLGAAAFGAVGVWRLGGLESSSDIFMNIASEPVLTSISLFSLLTNQPLPLVGKPYLFPLDFQSVVPSFLFPGKGQLFERIESYGYSFDAPLGGYHLFFSSLINFGIVGTVALSFLTGVALRSMLRPSAASNARQLLTSASLTGVFAFSIFRDPFFIGLVKNALTIGVAVPWLLVAFDRLLRPRRRVPRSFQRHLDTQPTR